MRIDRAVIASTCTAMALSAIAGALPLAASVAAAPAVVSGVEALGPIAVVPGTGPVNPTLPLSIVRGGVALSPRPVLLMPDDAASATQIELVDLSVGRSAWTWQGQVRSGRLTIARDLTSGHAYSWSWRDSPSGEWRTGGTFVAKFGSGTSQAAVAAGLASVDPFTGEAGVSWSSQEVSGPAGQVSAALEWRATRVGVQSDHGAEGVPAGWRLSATGGSPWVGLVESQDSVVRGVAPAAPRAVALAGGVRVLWRFPVGAARRFLVQVKSEGNTWRTVAQSPASQTSEIYDVTATTTSTLAPGDAVRVVARIGRVTASTKFLESSGLQVVSDIGVVTSRLTRAALAPAAPVDAAESGGLVVAGDAPRSVTVWGWDGSGLTFVRNASGVYEQVLTASTDVAGARNALERRLVDNAWIWEITDSSGLVTRFVDGRATRVSRGAMTLATLTWDNDRLVEVRPGGIAPDAPRAIGFIYGGSSACSSDEWADHGFAAAPTGMLCRITYGNGVATDLGYVDGVGGNVQIAVIKDPGNRSASYGWDSVGHLVSTRSDLVTRSALVNPALASLVATIDYDDRGRAVTIRDAAAATGAPRMVQRLSLPQVGEADVLSAAKVTARVDSSVGTATWSKLIEFDAAAQTPVGAIDRTGSKVTVASDRNGRPQRVVDPQKRVTTYEYDEAGLQTGQAGPFTGDANRGLVLDAAYDSTVDAGRTTAWTGMNVRLFNGEDFTGAASGAWWGRDDRSGLGFSWSTTPDGVSGSWSARATAKWTPRSDARDWSLRVNANGAQVSVLVDGELCVADNAGRCTITDLAAGAKSVTVQVNRATSSGGFRILAAPVGSEPALIPASQVEPLFGVVAVQALNDTYPGSERSPKTVKEYSRPWDDVTSSVTSPGGLVSAQRVEPIDPDNDRWGRPLSRTTPGGKDVTFTYYGRDESASPPSVCGGGAAVPQYGATKSMTRQDGSTEQRIFNSRGQLIAKVVGGDAGAQQTTCLAYDDAGQISSARVFNTAGVLLESTVIISAVDGKPWISATTVTHGPAAPVTPGASYTTTTQVDMAGRVVRFVDGVGTVTTTTYTDQGKPRQVTVTAPGSTSGAGRVLRFSFTYTAAEDWLDTVSVNGVQVADVGYDTAAGRVQSVQYADGTTLSYDYFGNGRANKATITYTGGRVVNSLDMRGTGRVMASTVTGTGASAWTEGRQYAYDAAGRLVSAIITSTQAGMPARTDLGYSFGPQAPRCAAGYAGSGRDSLRSGGSRNGVTYTTCHDAQGQTISTTDPLVTGGTGVAVLTHDRLGRVTRIDTPSRDVAMTWGVDTQLASVVDGPTTTSLNSFGAYLRDRTVTTASTLSRVAFGYAGPLADPGTKPDGTADPIGSAAPAPSFTYGLLDNDIASVASATFDLPGGAQVTMPTGGSAVMTLSDLDGAALITVPVPSVGSGASSELAPSVGPSDRYGPFGEALVTPTFTTAVPHYGWQNAESVDTLAGPSSISLMGARPYLPALGEFLAKDPDFNAGLNLYSYTSGDPINRQDLSGESETLNTVSLWLGVSAMLTSFLGPLGLAVGAVLSVGVAAVQGVQLAQQDEKVSVAQWIGLGASVLFAGLGGWSAFKAGKDLVYFTKLKHQSVAQQGGKFPKKIVWCAVSWGCAAAVRTEGVAIAQKLRAETAQEANRGFFQGGVIQGRKGFWIRLFAPGG